MDEWMHADLSSFSYIAHTRSKNSTSVSTGASWTRTGVRTRGAGVGRFGRVAMVRYEQSHTSKLERSNAVKTGKISSLENCLVQLKLRPLSQRVNDRTVITLK